MIKGTFVLVMEVCYEELVGVVSVREVMWEEGGGVMFRI